MEEARLMSKKGGRLRRTLEREEGGVHILLLGFFGIAFAVLLWVTVFNWLMQTGSLGKAKSVLNHAAHAASLSIDEAEAAHGRLVWDEAAGTESFYRYLRLNLKLDEELRPEAGSMLQEAPAVQLLEFVTNPTYPYVVRRSVTIQEGGAGRTTRNVEVTVYGPSVVAVLEIHRPLLGKGRSEPSLISSVASVRMR
ncbi:hypothetical protein KNP414_01017 [Paenibacillus mucilaginosus KNP414]|uniref:Uncharacterized protein n=2 Tax=Paenibacillus mucilaginosus TaxID=61624 RepID=F8FAF4_PAEMK|nr:hypothetical protein KNP414_01017 [Paenibacillus mucilaginosus KNP414]